MSKKWNVKQIIKFLEAYEENSCLWDVSSELYKIREAREIAYENMVQVMDIEGFGIQEVKAKIRSIRNAYTLELAKIEKSKKTGSDEIYKPKLSWYTTADRILHNVVQIRESQSARIESIKLESVIAAESAKCLRSRKLKRKSEKTDDDAKKQTEKTTESVKRKTQETTETIAEEQSKISKKLKESTTQEDEFECFGKCVATQLKKLPETAALKSMAFIQSYLVQQRLKTCPQNTARRRNNSDVSTGNNNINDSDFEEYILS